MLRMKYWRKTLRIVQEISLLTRLYLEIWVKKTLVSIPAQARNFYLTFLSLMRSQREYPLKQQAFISQNSVQNWPVTKPYIQAPVSLLENSPNQTISLRAKFGSARIKKL